METHDPPKLSALTIVDAPKRTPEAQYSRDLIIQRMTPKRL